MTVTAVAGMETRANVRQMVLGSGASAQQKAGGANTSLRGTEAGGARLDRVFQGSTAGLQTGFGYVLRFNRGNARHAIIATRGTRAEHSKADLYTDAHGSFTGFGDYGLVRTGFKNTFDSIRGGLASDDTRIMDADVVTASATAWAEPSPRWWRRTTRRAARRSSSTRSAARAWGRSARNARWNRRSASSTCTASRTTSTRSRWSARSRSAT